MAHKDTSHEPLTPRPAHLSQAARYMAGGMGNGGKAMTQLNAELREVATLAYRVLEEAHGVISTIDGDDTHEQHELSLLASRIKDISVSLFVVLRGPK